MATADGRAIEDSGLSRYIASKAPGSSVRLQVMRDGSQRTVPLTLGTFPDEGEREEAVQSRGEKLGMTLRDLTPSMAEQLQLPRGAKGVVVMGVEGGEAAEDAGLQRGDVIVSVDGEDVEDGPSSTRPSPRPIGRPRPPARPLRQRAPVPHSEAGLTPHHRARRASWPRATAGERRTTEAKGRCGDRERSSG